MKLIYKGNYKDETQLPKGILPQNAIKFKEPETPDKLNLVASLFTLPVLLLIALFVICSSLLHGSVNIYFGSPYIMLGLLLSFLTLFPHELLHAICFGKNAEVELYIAPKKLMLFVVSTQPITKMSFIIMSLLPNLVFGWFPLIIWTVLPYNEIYSNIIFSFSAISTLFGIGDYLNVYNAVRQMPKGSMQQLSGFHSYWFMP